MMTYSDLRRPSGFSLRAPGFSALLALTLALSACADMQPKQSATLDRINQEMSQASADASRGGKVPAAVADALLPPLNIELASGGDKRVEPRFDLAVNNAPASQVFLGIVSGTRYSMLLHPDVSGQISVNLKDVTVKEALDALRDLYGYDCRIDGSRIFVYPAGLQSRFFQVDYLLAQRQGNSDIRVTSGSVVDSGAGSSNSGSNSNQGSNSSGSSSTSRSLISSRISTTSNSDFWTELSEALKTIIGTADGRSVVVSPQSGVIVVRAMPSELQNVELYLNKAQLSMDRQVIIEAKIIEVNLQDSNQSGINWSYLNRNNQRLLSMGGDTSQFLYPGTSVGATPVGTADAATLGGVLGGGISAVKGMTKDGLFGIAFQTRNFAAVMEFLQTQGTIHVLSSPRIATLNNQQAVLKVGTDQFFVTNVSSSTTSTVSGTTSLPNVTLQPFFSGIVLDVTPQIDDDGNITLHVHPAISQVTSVETNIDLGTAGSLKLPLAQSSVRETDSIIRAEDGQIVAIGGLMKQSTDGLENQIPGLGNIPGVGVMFRNSNRSSQKQELVILLKATVVQGSASWNRDVQHSQERIQNITRPTSAR